MSSVSLKVSINPAIAKDLKNGNLLCMICNTQVKSKIWTAHSNGRKHRENIERLKKRHAASTQLALKRPPPELDPQEASPSSAPVKKSREEKVDAEMETIPSTQTPWQRGNKAEENKSKRPSRKNVIEGVPEGFFDDEKLNSRVVERIEKEEVMEKEFSKFMNELNEAELEKEEQQDIEEESTAIEHDIEHIDEQINHWKRVNRLELKREEIYSKSTVPNETEQRLGQEKQMEISGDDENDADGDDDFDFDPSNWRSKQI